MKRSQLSYTAPPSEHWNVTTTFSQAERNASFLGQGTISPGPGAYNVKKSTLTHPTRSVTRPSTFTRRAKKSCAALQGPLLTASLCGADQLLLDPAPSPGSYELKDSFSSALENEGFCTASYASTTSRFPPTRAQFGIPEDRPSHRKLKARPRITIDYPKLTARSTSPSQGFLPTCEPSSPPVEPITPDGFRPPDPFIFSDALRRMDGAHRTKVEKEMIESVELVKQLDHFSPPDGSAIKFY